MCVSGAASYMTWLTKQIHSLNLLRTCVLVWVSYLVTQHMLLPGNWFIKRGTSDINCLRRCCFNVSFTTINNMAWIWFQRCQNIAIDNCVSSLTQYRLYISNSQIIMVKMLLVIVLFVDFFMVVLIPTILFIQTQLRYATCSYHNNMYENIVTAWDVCQFSKVKGKCVCHLPSPKQMC